MKKKIFRFVYRTENAVNGKYYIGVHKTSNLEDGYLGSGVALKRAISKYGVENFTRSILYWCDTDDELFAKEKELVTEDVVKSRNNYNCRIGGKGGFSNHRPEFKLYRRKGGISLWDGMRKNKKKMKEYIAKVSDTKAKKKKSFINNGFTEKPHHPEKPLPVGWAYGKLTPDLKRKAMVKKILAAQRCK